MTAPLQRQPALRGSTLVYVSDDDLWRVDATGGRAERLTTGKTAISRPLLSRDGSTVVFTASEEGTPDLYAMDAQGGPIRRLTWLGGHVAARGFSADDHAVVFSTNQNQPFRPPQLGRVDLAGGCVERLQLGPAFGYDTCADGATVLCTHMEDLATWKRYRGGRMGRLWVDGDGSGQFVELPSLGGNLAQPRWVDLQDERRLLFVSDHEGVANLYSSRGNGQDVIAHTHHTERAVRWPAVCGTVVVYEFAGSLWRLDLVSGTTEPLVIEQRGQQSQAQTRHVPSQRFIEDAVAHPDGHSHLLTVRGKPFIGGHWEGPMVQLGLRNGVRYRLCTFDTSGEHAVWVSDEGGTEHLELCALDTLDVFPLDLDGQHSRLLSLVPGPDGRIAVVTDDNRVAVVLLDDNDSDGLIRSARLRWVSEAARRPPHGVSWSGDGRWLTFCEPVVGKGSRVVLADLADLDAPTVTEVTTGKFADSSPSFDPSGRYLVFLSAREFDPVRDRLQFNYGFPKGIRPYLVTLRADLYSPFEPQLRGFGKVKPAPVTSSFDIDLDGLPDRLVPFPVRANHYLRVCALPSGRFIFEKEGIRSVGLPPMRSSGPPPAHSQLTLWDPVTRDESVVLRSLSSFTLDGARQTVVARVGDRLRVFPADPDKAVRTALGKKEPWRAARSTYFVDPSRARLAIDPRAEWRQMLLEAWRLQRSNYWDPNHAGVDWEAIRDRYVSQVERVGTRTELTDLIQCMHGELATSHAYVIGGDLPVQVRRVVGRLAADVEWDGHTWVVSRIHRGEPGRARYSSPFSAPGVRINVGTRILAIDGQPLAEDRPMDSALVGHAGRPVRFTVQREGEEREVVWVTPLASDILPRYRTWVLDNQARVHAATNGTVGYVHLPDMSPSGFADFHRDFLRESERGGLIVDVRYNRGGHVSQMVLNKLMQRRLGYVNSRHFGITPYPSHAVAGPLVALCNAYSSSDGDIFSQYFKNLKLGPLIGERTWGGVVGISPRNHLVDRTLPTQPEFAHWLGPDMGYNVEGHGVDPDIEVVISPMDWATGSDPQLDRALVEMASAMENVDLHPDLGPRPIR